MIKAVIVDDEKHCLETMEILLQDHCPGLTVAEKCNNGEAAITAISRHRPQLVFLDIEMPGMTGFELLEHYPVIPFSVIFTTSYDQYAIKAIRFSALDYLLKPVDPQELKLAVARVIARYEEPAAFASRSADQFQLLFEQLRSPGSQFRKIAIPTLEGFELISLESICWCEANDNYTFIHLINKNRIVASRTLKEIGEQLEDHTNFVRVHHSYIVNLNEVSKYVKGEGGYLVMSDGTSINVSRSRKDALMKYFQ